MLLDLLTNTDDDEISHSTQTTPSSQLPECPPVDCRLACQHGFAKDHVTGCEICQCAASPVLDDTVTQGSNTQDDDDEIPDNDASGRNSPATCEPITCRMSCQFGWKKDKVTNCNICKCADPPTNNSQEIHSPESDLPENTAPDSDSGTEENRPVTCEPVNCRMSCQFGFAKDEVTGCYICQCADPPVNQSTGRHSPENGLPENNIPDQEDGIKENPCEPVTCMMMCQFGWAKDEVTNCEICQCADPPVSDNGSIEEGRTAQCEPLSCRITCQFGLAKDELTGCDICECAKPPVTIPPENNPSETIPDNQGVEEDRASQCEPVTCRMMCQYGWAKDEITGCDICECAQPPVTIPPENNPSENIVPDNEVAEESRVSQCEPVTCRMWCHFGWAKDEITGCDICQCAEGPGTVGTSEAATSIPDSLETPEKSVENIVDSGAVDRSGCQPVKCALWCSYGYATDPVTGCGVCQCAQLRTKRKTPFLYTTVKCEPINCELSCDHGYARHAVTGCEICTCAEAPMRPKREICPPVPCRMDCEHGFAKNELTGCDICICAHPVSANPSAVTTPSTKHPPAVTQTPVSAVTSSSITHYPPASSTSCVAVTCRIQCQYGLDRDASTGCPICRCRSPPDDKEVTTMSPADGNTENGECISHFLPLS